MTFRSHKLVIQQLDNATFINHEDIQYLKADNNYTDIVTIEKSVTASKTIKYFESQLPTPPFYRCHQSYLVNIQFLSEYDKKDQAITMKNGTQIPLSKNRKAGLFELISEW